MADADEDVIPRGPEVGDIDLSDETQDFRFLLSFSYGYALQENADFVLIFSQ